MSADTPLQQSEREKLQSAYSEIASLAGGLAHEIKNPLGTISLNLELLAEEVGDDESPAARRMLKKIETVQGECARLDEILRAFLQFVRAGELKLIESDLNQVVSEFVDFYQPTARKHGIDVSPHLTPDLPKICLDEALMRQVLMNLALNAQDAMPGGGLLEIQTGVGGDRGFISIIDNGRGMNEATRQRMFDAFFSSRSGGSGLGLPTVRKIVEAHGGKITCDSEPERGTRFTIDLPLAGKS